ncbi:helix-turn-helix domain-containing protein [Thiocapsa bogorovii]|uniref:helix-turn-helix domain-containing protein n=1 Tax=Thiocapsa bogorovii TaxID=521689 RepID=UPI001E4FEF8A|nr:hypothetical protein [Thiocapsa bogorovii]UHD16380.1 hypothetical protein LT988_24585 [Thiocapsa bogorovii]
MTGSRERLVERIGNSTYLCVDLPCNRNAGQRAALATLWIITAFLILDNLASLPGMDSTMSARPPLASPAAAVKHKVLDERIRARHRGLGIDATVIAEAAGTSRITLDRIEKGEPAPTIGAYLNAVVALGLDFDILTPVNPGDAVGDDAKPG